jgi:hypothetical protein
MRTALEVLDAVQAVGGTLIQNGDRLIVRAGSATPIPAAVVAAARIRKTELIRLLAVKMRITESEENWSGPWSLQLTFLCRRHPPADMPAQRWVQFIDDAHRFVNHGWVTRAAALGWRTHDLFGCDSLKPYSRIDRQGLLWLLNGRPLASLTADTAAIRTASGAHVTFYRHCSEPEQVLPWNLFVGGQVMSDDCACNHDLGPRARIWASARDVQ